MLKYLAIDNKIIPVNEAKISVFDYSLLGGVGVYETMLLNQGKVAQIKLHLRRFRRSAGELGLTINFPDFEIKNILDKLVKKNKVKRARIRLTLTKGSLEDHNFPVQSSLIIFLQEFLFNSKSSVAKTAIAYSVERIFPEIKSTCLLPQYMALREAKKANVFEALLINRQNEVLEGAISNVFFVKDDVLLTPKEGILQGIARDLLLKIAKKEKIRFEFKKIKVKDLGKMDVCFVCNALRGITPIKSIVNLGIDYPARNELVLFLQKKLALLLGE